MAADMNATEVLDLAVKQLGHVQGGGHPLATEQVVSAMQNVLGNAGSVFLSVVSATQTPPAVDQPGGVHYGNPEAAVRTAEYHIDRELRLARAIIAAI